MTPGESDSFQDVKSRTPVGSSSLAVSFRDPYRALHPSVIGDLDITPGIDFDSRIHRLRGPIPPMGGYGHDRIGLPFFESVVCFAPEHDLGHEIMCWFRIFVRFPNVSSSRFVRFPNIQDMENVRFLNVTGQRPSCLSSRTAIRGMCAQRSEKADVQGPLVSARMTSFLSLLRSHQAIREADRIMNRAITRMNTGIIIPCS